MPRLSVVAETQSNTEPFWLVRVVRVIKKLTTSEVSEIGEGDGKVTVTCTRGEPALEVTKLFYSRNEAISTFCDDTDNRQAASAAHPTAAFACREDQSDSKGNHKRHRQQKKQSCSERRRHK